MKITCPNCKAEFDTPNPVQSKAGHQRWCGVSSEQRSEWMKKGWIKRKANKAAPTVPTK